MVGQWQNEERQTDKKTERKSQRNPRCLRLREKQESQLFDGKASAGMKSSKGKGKGDWSWKKKEVRVGCAQRACKESHFKASKYQGISGEGK